MGLIGIEIVIGYACCRSEGSIVVKATALCEPEITAHMIRDTLKGIMHLLESLQVKILYRSFPPDFLFTGSPLSFQLSERLVALFHYLKVLYQLIIVLDGLEDFFLPVGVQNRFLLVM